MLSFIKYIHIEDQLRAASVFFLNDTATTEIYTLSLHDALPISVMTPTFYTFREREQLMDVVELITGGRLHPSWFRIGGVAMDLPEGWKDAVDAFVKVLRERIRDYEALITKNPIFKARTRGVG